MDKIKLDILGLTSSQSEVGHFALVLVERGGNRRLPIIIDGYQARAIALELEKIRPNRPMTHDLIVSIARSFEIELVEVIITELKDGIFYARLVFDHHGEIREVDSRTSDAVAIGVRFNVPIYTYESVLALAGIEVKDSELGEEELHDELADDPELEEEEDEEDEELDLPPAEESMADKIRKLNEAIQDAIAKEDYEKAARLRDEINRLEEPGN